MYRIIDEEYVEIFINENTRKFVTKDDEDYQKWLAKGNAPIPKNGINKFISEEERRINDLELYILTREGLI